LGVDIDGAVFREGYEAELLQRIMNIREVHFHTVQGEALVSDIIEELKGYIPKVLQAMESISDLFYGEMTPDDWNLFSRLIEAINWVEQSVRVVIDQFKRFSGVETEGQPFYMFVEQLPAKLRELEESLERYDPVAAGDLIKYELRELFEQLATTVESKVTL